MSDINFGYARMIGEKLRSARQQRKMSLRELAEKASISASMLSQIETGKAYPSVRSIYNIAAALALPVDFFFPEQDDSDSSPSQLGDEAMEEMTASEMREASVNRSANASASKLFPSAAVVADLLHAYARPTIQLKGGVTWSRLTTTAETGIEFLEITYGCGATSGANMSSHEGREFGLILEGELVVQLGFEQFTLHAGDSIVFDSTIPHRLTNKGSEQMRALWVVWNHA